jgi:hypothetical protein
MSRKLGERIYVTISIFKSPNGWRWQIREIQSNKIIGASTEAYGKRIDAFKNLQAVTGWEPRFIPARGERQKVYRWDVYLATYRQDWA